MEKTKNSIWSKLPKPIILTLAYSLFLIFYTVMRKKWQKLGNFFQEFEK